jgi:hypothetical protein
MMRRHIYRGLIVGALLTISTGCDTLHSFLRAKDSEYGSAKRDDKDDSSHLKAVDWDTSKVLDVDSDSKNSQPFFKNNRTSGGWSSEAREIEKSLGVGN